MTPEEPMKIDPAIRKVMEIPDDQELPDDALCDVMIRALESPQLLIRSSAMNQLVDLGKRTPNMAIPKILKALDPAIDFWTVRFGALEALGEIANTNTVDPLIQYLEKDKDPDFRAMVAKQLGIMGEIAKRAGQSLTRAIYDIESSEIRENAARALGQLKVLNAVEPLIATLKIESDEYARREMCWSLGELKNTQALPILIEKLKDIDVETRGNAAEALGKIQNKDAVLHLLRASRDGNVDVQAKAIWALKQIPIENIIDEIERVAEGDRLVSIKFYDEYLFNVKNDAIAQKVKGLKDPIIAEYREELEKIRTILEGCKVFTEEVFQKLKDLSKDEIKNLLEYQVPSTESKIANVSFYKFKKYKWVQNDLFFDIDQVEKIYKEAGVMISELRDNALALQKKKKIETIAVEDQGEDSTI